jgi:hypothetical protein
MMSVPMVLLVLPIILTPLFRAGGGLGADGDNVVDTNYLAAVCCSGDGHGMELRSQRMRFKRAAELKGKQADDLRAAVVSLVPV